MGEAGPALWPLQARAAGEKATWEIGVTGTRAPNDVMRPEAKKDCGGGEGAKGEEDATAGVSEGEEGRGKGEESGLIACRPEREAASGERQRGRGRRGEGGSVRGRSGRQWALRLKSCGTVLGACWWSQSWCLHA